jgi:hypothetical protein
LPVVVWFGVFLGIRLLVRLTGVGGGSLMAPLLVLPDLAGMLLLIGAKFVLRSRPLT